MNNPPTTDPTIMVDIDGVLSDDRWRRHHWLHKNYNLYHSCSPKDQPILGIVHLLNCWQGHVVLSTARPEQYRLMTESWLSKYHIRYDQLLMRKEQDQEPTSPEIKVKHLSEIRKSGHVVLLMIDDRRDVCKVMGHQAVDNLTFSKGYPLS